MEDMFAFNPTFNNSGLSGWNVSAVTTMRSMFSGCSSFNQPLNTWDVSRVTDVMFMFYGATTFNQPLNNWDTSSFIKLGSMFAFAKSFNQPVDAWHLRSAIGLGAMFSYTDAFDQSLADWNLTSVLGISFMFQNATAFNQDLRCWCVSRFPTEPEKFSQYSALSPANMPRWGHCDGCPTPEAPPVSVSPSACGGTLPPPNAFNISCIDDILYFDTLPSYFVGCNGNSCIIQPNWRVRLLPLSNDSIVNATISLRIAESNGTTQTLSNGLVIVQSCITFQTGQVVVYSDNLSSLVGKNARFMLIERPDCFVQRFDQSTTIIYKTPADCRIVKGVINQQDLSAQIKTLVVAFSADEDSSCKGQPPVGLILGLCLGALGLIVVSFILWRVISHWKKPKEAQRLLDHPEL
jgi:surface protein